MDYESGPGGGLGGITILVFIILGSIVWLFQHLWDWMTFTY